LGDWQLESLAGENLGDVQVEEVNVEDSLHATSNNRNVIVESFVVEPPNPVDQIECSVGAQKE
jgi:hypothetical protein